MIAHSIIDRLDTDSIVDGFTEALQEIGKQCGVYGDFVGICRGPFTPLVPRDTHLNFLQMAQLFRQRDDRAISMP